MVSRQADKRKIPPARARYESSHPTVTARVDLSLYRELKRLKGEAGLSVADVLKIGLERAQADTKSAFDAGYAQGHSKGREKGKSEGWKSAVTKTEVTYFCARCGLRHLSIDSDDERNAVAELMREAGWCSLDCEEN